MNEKKASEINRRDFLKSAGFFTCGYLLCSGLSSCRTFYSLKSYGDFFKTGHCAPTIMKALQSILKMKDEYIVRATSGLAGGISRGEEYGGISSPIMIMGMKYGFRHSADELPEIFPVALNHIREFENENHSASCSWIVKNNGKNACKNVIGTTADICINCMKKKSHIPVIKKKSKEAYLSILNYFEKNNFHCAHYVLKKLSGCIAITDNLLKSSWGFIGGTLLQGGTCAALISGVLAIGAKYGDTGNTYSNVIRAMNRRKKNEIVDSKIDNFYNSQEICKDFCDWFEREYGSIKCNEITGCNFSICKDIEGFISSNKIARCKVIVENVAAKLEGLLA